MNSAFVCISRQAVQFWINIFNPEVLVVNDVLSLRYLLKDFDGESCASLLSLRRRQYTAAVYIRGLQHSPALNASNYPAVSNRVLLLGSLQTLHEKLDGLLPLEFLGPVARVVKVPVLM